MFFPPELMAHQEEAEGLAGLPMESLRRLYHLRNRQPNDRLDRVLVSLVLDRAREIVSHPTRPTVRRMERFVDAPTHELALEESVEESPLLREPEDFLVECVQDKHFSCVAMLDSSASMSGEKHLLASIAVAVLILEMASEDFGLVLFSSDAKRIKTFGVDEAREETVLRFLRTQPRGFTDIARGLRFGVDECLRFGRRKKLGLLATDGRTTQGEDPVNAAREFDFLVVLHLHGPGSHLDSSRAIAQAGNGICLEVERFDELPRRCYDAVRLLARR